jgi:isoleucyl-tRNA synthetase
MSDDTSTTSKGRDYRDTVFLPKTDFPMKAGLPAKEPGIAARWDEMGLYRKLRDARAGREKFILHDGPPYANGDIHIGHALNKVLKDMVVRSQNLLGRDAPYVPGWDCHGLPIEWKIEEQYRKQKRNKDEVPAKEFRAECRAYAAEWVAVQSAQFKRLGIMGDWDNPYLTMDFQAEATIVAELLKFAESGNIYRGAKPVMWSPVEKTALAEAEVEYEDITSTQIDVAFEIVKCPNAPELVGAYLVIWTTTPWTIPVNQAIAYGDSLKYRVFEFGGKRLIMEKSNQIGADFFERLQHGWHPFDQQIVDEVQIGNTELIPSAAFDGMMVRHPMYKRGGFFEKLRPVLCADFVDNEQGTGLVHMAPDHGEDDFELCKSAGINPVFAVMDDGRYRDDWPWLGASDCDAEGKERRRAVINNAFNAPDGPICADLRAAGALLSAGEYHHSYPHSWRSKAKVIFRCTPQWFVPMDRPLPSPSSSEEGLGVVAVGSGGTPERTAPQPATTPDPSFEKEGGTTLRNIALSEIARVQFTPDKGRNRIGAMVSGRPDWVLSRQRAWGVPITLFVRPDGTYLADPEVNARIIAAVREEGVDAWDEGRKAEYLGPDHNPDDFEMVTDILDVWFDSGCTHAFVLDSGRWPDLTWPANLYLEGSDQHRGWFQSSLLQSCATRGRAPYDQILTHGFTMDAKGKKMSKSLGNTISPLKVMEEYGADIIRLWALSVDFTEDHRIGDEILKGVGDQYRKLRNTFRYLLGALDGFTEDERIAPDAMPELERYVLGLLGDLDAHLRAAALAYDFNAYTRLLVDFCNEDLSAFFFDIRKDSLYCDGADSLTRRAYRSVLDTLFHALVRYAAPVLVFTAEEVWLSRYPDGESVHLAEWPEVPFVDVDRTKWTALRALRDTVNEAIEPLRRDKTIRSSLEAEVTLPDIGGILEGYRDSDFLPELFITAAVHFDKDVDKPVITKTTHHKCARCWRHLPDVAAAEGALCGRCEDVVGA